MQAQEGAFLISGIASLKPHLIYPQGNLPAGKEAG
jgi:hypothetical protein